MRPHIVIDVDDLAMAYNVSKFGTGRGAASALVRVSEQGRPVWYGTWVLGADYRATAPFYGSYPRGYLPRLEVMFAQLRAHGVHGLTIHACSGSLPHSDHYVTVDGHPDRGADVCADVTRLHEHEAFKGVLARLIYMDPPYSPADAQKYGTRMLNRGAAMRSFAAITETGGYVAWLDTQTPIYRKDEWYLCMRISIDTGTNKRARVLRVFQRTDHPASVLSAPARKSHQSVVDEPPAMTRRRAVTAGGAGLFDGLAD